MERIKTEYWPKPIPIRRFDWQATFESYEPGDAVGHGETELEAISDLLERLEERGPAQNV